MSEERQGAEASQEQHGQCYHKRRAADINRRREGRRFRLVLMGVAPHRVDQLGEGILRIRPEFSGIAPPSPPSGKAAASAPGLSMPGAELACFCLDPSPCARLDSGIGTKSGDNGYSANRSRNAYSAAYGFARLVRHRALHIRWNNSGIIGA